MAEAPRQTPVERSPPHRDASRTVVPRKASSDLFGASERLVIEHRGEEYQLRITRQGKLILTK